MQIMENIRVLNLRFGKKNNVSRYTFPAKGLHEIFLEEIRKAGVQLTSTLGIRQWIL